MKRSMGALAAALLITALSGQALAEEKKGTIGIGSYVIIMDINGFGSSTYAGSAVVASYNFTPLISASTHIYSTTLNNGTEKIGGYDALVRFGKQDTGFTYFAGIGFYSETVTDFGFSLDASGSAFGFGIGYNWDDVALTYEASGRTTSDYESALGRSVIETAGSLNIAYRF